MASITQYVYEKWQNIRLKLYKNLIQQLFEFSQTLLMYDSHYK